MKDRDGLSPRQRLFVQSYLIEPNGAKASIAAGYSANGADVQAVRLLANAKVAAAIAKKQAIVAEKMQISHEWVIERLIQNHERAMQAEPVMKFDHESKTMVETGEYVYNGAVANRSLELIGKHLGTFPERMVVEDPKAMPRHQVATRVRELRKMLKLA